MTSRYTINDPVVGQVSFETGTLLGGKSITKVFDATVSKPINGISSYCIKLSNVKEGISLKSEAFQMFQTKGIRVARVVSMGSFISETPYFKFNYQYQIMEKYSRVLTMNEPSSLMKKVIFDVSETMLKLREQGLMHRDVSASNIATNDDKTFYLIDTDKIDLYDERIFKENFVNSTLWLIRPRMDVSVFDIITPFVSSPETLVEFLLSPSVFLASLASRTPDTNHPRYEHLKTAQENSMRQCFYDPTGRSSSNQVDKLMAEKFQTEIMAQLPNFDVDRILNRAPSGCYVNKAYFDVSQFK